MKDPVENAKHPIEDEDSTAMKLSKIIFADFPGLETGEAVQTTMAACTLADVLGCVVALLQPRFTPEDFARVKEELRKRIDRSTDDIVSVGTAAREARSAQKH